MSMGEEHANKARVQTLESELDGMYMDDSEKNIDFSLKHHQAMGDVTELAIMETIICLRAFEESSWGFRCDKEGGPQLLFVGAEPHLTRVEWEAKVVEEKNYRGKFDKSKIDCRKCG
ncbi:hypothetical protein GUJ93_ZPchr0012g19974 [Zizania palustris]|uniref:Uncharacterized protein n=1 Tax=Zizania palustris TaxID=103762 RepID=A0A8J5WPL8_ZIZPA|nr:hypothetical protein GUJ93_ZPchr0012g19974 [Zizania palustris]